jgi:hypothetical protein
MEYPNGTTDKQTAQCTELILLSMNAWEPKEEHKAQYRRGRNGEQTGFQKNKQLRLAKLDIELTWWWWDSGMG